MKLSECLVEENCYIVVSPKDIVVASPYDFDDRIDWLIEHLWVVYFFLLLLAYMSNTSVILYSKQNVEH